MKTLSFLLLFTCTQSFPNILLQKPKDVSAQELDTLINNWHTQFRWSFGKGRILTLGYNKHQPYILLQAFGIPIRSYQFPYWHYLKQLIASIGQPIPSYFYAQPLKLEKQTPEQLTITELAHFMHYKKFIFYTGAGISAAAKVATMRDLETSLHIDPNNKTQFFKSIILDPQSIAKTFGQFCQSAIDELPTAAHYALHELAYRYHCCIVTENIDLLQQRTGINPIHSHSTEITSLIPQDLQDVDIVCCIGLSQDDCGLLAHYKSINPNGTIIAIDQALPNYVSNTDIFMQGDLQTIVPALARLLCS